MLLQALPEVMGVGFGDAAALAVLSWRDGREFLFAPGQDIAIAFLEVFVFAASEFLAFALGDARAGLLEQPLHIGGPGVALGVDDEGQLAQQVRATQAVIAVIVGEIGGPAIMDDHACRSVGSRRWPASPPARVWGAGISR